MRLRGMIKRMIRRRVRHPYSCSLRKFNVVRQRLNLIFLRESVFGIGSGQRTSGENAVAWFYLGDACTYRLDNSSSVRAWCVRQLGLNGISSRALRSFVGID